MTAPVDWVRRRYPLTNDVARQTAYERKVIPTDSGTDFSPSALREGFYFVDRTWFYSRISMAGDPSSLAEKRNVTRVRPVDEALFETDCSIGDLRIRYTTMAHPFQMTIIGVQVSVPERERPRGFGMCLWLIEGERETSHVEVGAPHTLIRRAHPHLESPSSSGEPTLIRRAHPHPEHAPTPRTTIASCR